MPFHPELHHRRSIRLPHWDYARAGAYVVTVVTHGREQIFGEILDGQMHFSDAGQVCAEEWLGSAAIRAEVSLDAWVVMPNHLNGVVLFGEPCREMLAATSGATAGRPYGGRGFVGPRPRSLSALVAGFKSAVTRRLNLLQGSAGSVIWQRNYCEQIIRDQAALHAVREYIQNNPARWAEDKENPHAPSTQPRHRGRSLGRNPTRLQA